MLLPAASRILIRVEHDLPAVIEVVQCIIAQPAGVETESMVMNIRDSISHRTHKEQGSKQTHEETGLA